MILDDSSNEPVEYVHVFISNTTYGTISDVDGRVILEIPDELKEDMIISHLSYEIVILENHQYRQLTNGDEVLLSANALELSEVEIVSKTDKRRKKLIKKFYKAFFGDNDQGEQCQVVNTEVLRFKEEKGNLLVTADDILKIENPFLGYKINYLLRYLKLDRTGSIEFLGQSHFVDWIDGDKDEIYDNRNEVYVNSPKYFFKNFIDGTAGKLGFEVSQVNYNDGRFYLEKTLERDSILNASKDGKKFTIQFKNYLQVLNTNEQEISYASVGVRPGGLESQRFGSSGRTSGSTSIEYQTSYVYKLSPYLILNQHGNLLNSKDVREYGYWAERKMAHQLPFDYGNNYSFSQTSPIEKPLEDDSLINQNGLSDQDKVVLFVSLLRDEEKRIKEQTLEMISQHWEQGFSAALIEVLRFSQEEWLNESINRLLALKNDINSLSNFYNWLEWIWLQKIPQEKYLFNLKAEIYKNIDPKFEKYFIGRQEESLIRIDEVVWGGVEQDGIPPLRDPEMISANNEDYLDDNNVVFGIYINGIARAYPKRILAWHEFFVDDFADQRIAGVYCTLCGTVIAYDMTYNGIYHDLGTSGFLYRSNKLMYDKATQSIWSTIEGRPVIGPLSHKKITLETYPVVTTTWKEWKAKHPDTEVLSINTGHQRDYKEGAAYAEYFGTDELMFPVPSMDQSLKNKDEVFVIRSEEYMRDPLAISVDYLRQNKWYQGSVGNSPFVAISDGSGAVRAYKSKGVIFRTVKGDQLVDSNNRKWKVQEECITSDDGQKLDRIPGHNVFWFAWYNAYPETRLVK